MYTISMSVDEALCPVLHIVLYVVIVRSAARLCEGDRFTLAHRWKVSALCLLYEIYHRVDKPLNGYLNYFVAARNTRALAALG